MAPRWWEAQQLKEQWNGVFQGGGAKGVAYVGVLQAVLEAKCWFRATAGSSAGAITATMIAAGIHPDDMDEAAATTGRDPASTAIPELSHSTD
jgi:predicted acylesterase/phospholipase RssA